MQVLFLDFDGVLNSKQHFMMIKNKPVPTDHNYPEFAEFSESKQMLNENNMWVLGYILTQLPDLKVVISSAWGKLYDLEYFKRIFKAFELDETRLIGITPRKMSSYRCNEIHWSLELLTEEYHELIQWIAVDDHEIFRLDEDDIHNQYLTDGWVGLTMLDALKIIEHFDPKFKLPWFGI